MRPGTVLVLLLGLILAVGAGVGGWEALRTQSSPARPVGLHGVAGLLSAPPADNPNGPLQARVTVHYNVATQQAKCYVGSTFCGIVGQGGEANGAARLKEVAASAASAGLSVNVVVDAGPSLPYPHLLHVVNVVTIATGATPTFALPAKPVQSPKPRNAPGPGLPVIENARTVDFAGAPWLLDLNGVTGDWSLGVFGATPERVGLDQIPARIQQGRAQLQPGVADAVLIRLPGDSTWGVAQAAIQRLRSGGLRQAVFLTKPPEPPPAPSGPNAK